MASHEELMAADLADILTSNPVTALHPGNSLLVSHLYPSVDSINSDSVPVLNTRGRFSVSSNSLSMPGTSTFQIPPGSFCSTVWLNVAVDIPRYCHAPKGWGLEMIDQIVYQFSGSSTMNNAPLDGGSHKQIILTSADNKEKRDALLEACGDYLNGTAAALTDQQASIPIYLPWSSPDVHGNFPYDTTTLSSNIQIQIRWKPSYKVFYGQTGQTPVMPSAFNYIELKAKQADITSGRAFAVNSAMNRDPELVYSFPYVYTQSYSSNETVTSGTQGIITLQALPVGQLCAILVEPILATQVGITTNANVVTGGSLIMDYMNLRYAGSDLIKYDYKKEQQLVDTMETNGNAYRYDTISGQAIGTDTATTYNNAVTVLPLMYDLNGLLMDRHSEAVNSYGGSVMEFRYRIDSYSLSAAAVEFKFTYLVNAIAENKFHVVRAIM